MTGHSKDDERNSGLKTLIMIEMVQVAMVLLLTMLTIFWLQLLPSTRSLGHLESGLLETKLESGLLDLLEAKDESGLLEAKDDETLKADSVTF